MTMREVMDRIFSRFSVDGLGRHWIRLNEYDWQLIKSALSAPPRNCDVGSEDEQSRRYEAFCEAHHMQCDKVCSACPCSKKSGVSCELYWAQMPYEKQEVGTT